MHNEALEYAVQRANENDLPLVAVFGSTAGFPHANERHLAFMYRGLIELRETLETSRGIQLLAYTPEGGGEPGEVIVAASAGAKEVVVDAGYTRPLRDWRRHVAKGVNRLVTEVECDVVVPLYGPGGGAGRSEPAAATLRPKILSRMPALTRHELQPTSLRRRVLTGAAAEALLLGGEGDVGMAGFARVPLWDSVDACLDALDAAVLGAGVDRSVKPADGYHVGGEREALRKLDHFLATKLNDYARSRNDPSLRLQSHLSPHIHYGQISVVYVAHRARKVAAARPELRRSVDVFLDELVVRRELAINYCLNNSNYDAYEGVPDWARRTLADHAADPRLFVYTLEQFERCATHDALWNAAQRELVVSGKQHNYLRMYWAKKILEWSADPREAWRWAIHLNNKYSLDGRDPSSYTGVGWCWGLHDREFPESAVTGTVRRMSEAGMRSKFNAGVSNYLSRWGDGDARYRAGKRSAAKAAAESVAGTPGNGTPRAESRQTRLEEMFSKKPKMAGNGG
jgi:deoxyribodipyrimidine photo-lyase